MVFLNKPSGKTFYFICFGIRESVRKTTTMEKVYGLVLVILFLDKISLKDALAGFLHL